MGQGSHVLTFPVNQGRTLNIVAFHTTTEDWSYSEKLTKPGTKSEALRDYKSFGPNVVELLKLCKEDLDIVRRTQYSFHLEKLMHDSGLYLTLQKTQCQPFRKDEYVLLATPHMRHLHIMAPARASA